TSSGCARRAESPSWWRSPACGRPEVALMVAVVLLTPVVLRATFNLESPLDEPYRTGSDLSAAGDFPAK
ncbi:MAG: hypothetical protein ACJ781_05685, partial [Myxococcales bacterium]